MRRSFLIVASVGFGLSAIGAEARQLDSHEHGVGTLNIAFEGGQVAIELEAPGADIVGFEHSPESAEDRAKVDAAIAVLAKPLTLFALPAAAGCSVVAAKASLVGEDTEEAHHDDDHGHGHDHSDDHAAEEAHDDHADEAVHSEFRAEYVLSCDDIQEIDRIDFGYFTQFPNALELEIQMISDKGSKGFEVERDAPSLFLAGAI